MWFVFILSVIALVCIVSHKMKQEAAYREQRRIFKENMEKAYGNGRTEEPAPPKSKNKYTIYSQNEAAAMARRVLEDMPSDIFSIELLPLKEQVIQLFNKCQHEFSPGDDARFHVYKVLYSHTYELLLNDQCYFLRDFSNIGRSVYRLCTYCLDESHRLGYVDDALYKAQKNNISINVRNGKSFS